VDRLSRVATRKVPSGRTRRNGVERDVIDATIRCLAAGESITNLGIQRICDEAGVARSAFYKNFTDKTDLMLRTVQTATGDLFATACAWAAGSGGRKSMAAAHLNTVRVWREHAPLLKAYFEVAAYDPDLAAFWEERMSAVVDVMEDRIRTGQDQGLVSRKLNATALAEFVVYGFERRTAQHVASAPPSADKQFAQDLADIGWALMYGPDRDEI
jgi:TetR/AcrR family transcriptional regulator, ethionamide resistance regulator